MKKMTDKELIKKYRAFLVSVELCGETTEKTFEEFKEDYLNSNAQSWQTSNQ